MASKQQPWLSKFNIPVHIYVLRGDTEVCKLVIHRRGHIGSGSQVLNYVRLSVSKANSFCYNFHLPIALDN